MDISNCIFEDMKNRTRFKFLLSVPFVVVIYILLSWNANQTDAQREILPKVPAPIVLENAWVDAVIDTMTLREKIGQFFMVAVYPNKSESHF